MTDPEIQKLPIDEFTTATVGGDGIFDVLMTAVKAHIHEEFDRGRIKGTEYATVYLGSIQNTMQTALQFFVQGRKALLEEKLLEKQLELADKEIEAANKRLEMLDCEKALCQAQVVKTTAEAELLQAQKNKIPHEIALAQAEAELAAKRVDIAEQEYLLHLEQVLIAKEQLRRMPKELEKLEAETGLITQNTALAVLQEDTVRKEQCKLDAEFDLIMANVTKSGAETSLLSQKEATERAQVSGQGVDPDSIIGKQKLLYAAQTKGFADDAVSKFAQGIMDTWKVRRTTDVDVVADNTNKLSDAHVGKAIQQWAAQLGFAI